MPGTPRTARPPARGRPHHLRAATMHGVAEHVGVSHQTVSRVLNGDDAVSARTRALVLQAIEDLGYRRNSAARALVTRRSQVLGVVSFDTTLYGPASTLFGIEQAARAAGYFVSVASVKATTGGTVRAAVDRLTDQNVDGVVVMPRCAPASRCPRCRPGCPQWSWTGGPARARPRSGSTRRRAAGWPPATCSSAAPARSGTSPGRPTGSTPRAGWRAGGARCRTPGPRCPARCAGPGARPPATRPVAGWPGAATSRPSSPANDQMALGLLRAFHEAGVRVPRDVLVAGFDDVPEAAYYTPPLTTVRQDFAAVGRRSIELLLRQVGGRPGAPEAVVRPELVVRLSSGPV